MWMTQGLYLLVVASCIAVASPWNCTSRAKSLQAEEDRIVVDRNVQTFNISGDFWWLQGKPSNVAKPSCPQGYDCVADFQCVNGMVNTDGVGSLDVRVGPSRFSATTDLQSCSVPEVSNGVCCRLPGGQETPTSEGVTVISSTGIDREDQIAGSGGIGLGAGASPWEEPSSLPVSEQCDAGSECTPVILCHNGVIDVDGGDLLDVRVKPLPNKGCVKHDHPDVEAVCCRIPGSEPSVATPPSVTTLPPVTPALLTTCPGSYECVYGHQCNADGTANTDGSGTIDVRIRPLQACFLAGTLDVGVCCLPPPPPVLSPCPGTATCIPAGDCVGNAIDFDFQLVPYTANILWAQCPLSGNRNEMGICCEYSGPPTQVPLTTCPGQLECVFEEQCGQDSSIITDGTDLFDLRNHFNAKCYLEGSDVPGVCCRPPVTVVAVCPGASVCIPDVLCTGDALDSNQQFVPYDATHDHWTQCSMFGGLSSPGICCANPVIPTSLPTYPVATTCGIRNEGPSLMDTRISSPDSEAKFGEFPWQAIIFFSNQTFKCGATLIGEKWLLTAAHCVSDLSPAEIQIRLGEWQVNTFDEPFPYVDVTVKAIHVHPRFNPRNVHNDVAVLEVVPLDGFSYHINAVCLPKSDVKSAEPFVGKRCFATGWGKDAFEGNYQEILKKIDLPVVGHERCQSLLRRTRLGRYFVLNKSFMCAGGEENKDACKGDGGGPLVCEDSPGVYQLVGITAWGIGCGTKDVPGVYADVAALSDFVYSVIGGEAAGPAYGR